MTSAANDFDKMIMDFMNDDPMTAIYLQPTKGKYDPVTSTTPVVVVEIPVRAILLDVDRASNGLSSKFGSEILIGDKELYCLPPNKLNPAAPPLIVNTVLDTIRVGGITYKIHVMKEANPNAAAPLLFNFMLRR